MSDRNRRAYEWVAEQMDLSSGPLMGMDTDIIDPMFEERLSNLWPPASDTRIALVLRIGNEPNGEQERDYAYVVGGSLPERFEELGITIPRRFHEELRAVIEREGAA